MLVTNVLPLLALSQVSHAFYPYVPEWRCELDHDCAASKRSELDTPNLDGRILTLKQRVPDLETRETNHAESIRLLAARLKRKYNRGNNVEQLAADVIEKRSSFSTVSASTPTQTNSAGIDQDGTDYSYFAQIQLGTRVEPYSMLLDTGAGQTWVMGSSCTSNPCLSHETFGPTDSTTYKATTKAFSIQYGTGEVAGVQATDSIAFAGLKLDMTFGIANETSTDFNNFPIDGILGLSRMASTSPNFLQSLVSSKQLDSNIFGVALSRAADGSNNGEINFGKIDTSRFSGDISYTAISTKTVSDWAVPLDNIGVGTTKSSVTSGTIAYVDTGTSFIFASPADVKAFHSVVDGATSTNGQTYYVPCTTTDSAFVTFSGVTYQISSKDWVGPQVNGQCTSNVYGIEVVTGSWLLGDVFLKNVYAVFDVDESRLGFAARNAAVASASSPSSTGGLPSPTPTDPLVSTSGSGSGSPVPTVGPNTTPDTSSNGNPTELLTGTNTASTTVATATGAVTTASPGINGHQTSSPTGSGSAVADSTSGVTPPTTASSSQKSAAQALSASLSVILLTLLVIALTV